MDVFAEGGSRRKTRSKRRHTKRRRTKRRHTKRGHTKRRHRRRRRNIRGGGPCTITDNELRSLRDRNPDARGIELDKLIQKYQNDCHRKRKNKENAQIVLDTAMEQVASQTGAGAANQLEYVINYVKSMDSDINTSAAEAKLEELRPSRPVLKRQQATKSF